MGTLNNPGQYDCLTKLQANPDMPYFLLLAKDKSAPETVRHWASHAMNNGVNPEKVAEALKCADQMEVWQNANGAKVPD